MVQRILRRNNDLLCGHPSRPSLLKIFSSTIATALMVAISGVLLYIGLHALMLRAEVLLPGAVLRLPDAPAKGVVLLFKDATRAPQAADYGAALLRLSYAVLDMPNSPPPGAVLDALAEQLAARAGIAARAPVLVSLGPGVSRAAVRTLAAGAGLHALVSIDYCPAGAGNTPVGGALSRAPWYALQHRDPHCPAEAIETALGAVPNTHLTWLDAAQASDPAPPAEFSALLQWLDPSIVAQGQASERLRGIPLIELPVVHARRAVIFLSGDGGWATLDRGVAAALNAQGIAVLGWDTLSYFWQARSAAVLARDLERVINEFHARWQFSELVIAGYSFGASTVPFAVSGLEPATRKLIEKVVLLGPTATTSFEFRLRQWLGSDAQDSVTVAPEVAKLAPLPVWCVHATQDREARCPPLAPPSQVLILPGDHHFNGDYATLARVIATPLLTR